MLVVLIFYITILFVIPLVDNAWNVSVNCDELMSFWPLVSITRLMKTLDGVSIQDSEHVANTLVEVYSVPYEV